MESHERRQLHDEIIDGSVAVSSLSLTQLKGLLEDFDLDEDYNPKFPFFALIDDEVHRRERVPKRAVNIDRNFFR